MNEVCKQREREDPQLDQLQERPQKLLVKDFPRVWDPRGVGPLKARAEGHEIWASKF